MLTTWLKHQTFERLGIPTVLFRLAAVRLDMSEVELGLSRMAILARSVACTSPSSSAARSRVGLP